jgi:hypothetical protein
VAFGNGILQSIAKNSTRPEQVSSRLMVINAEISHREIMTTNVYDQNQGVMASDSRWSIRHGNYVVYLDDTGFDKIEIRKGAAFMFAGNGGRIQQWKSWLRTDPADDSQQPPEDRICICIADMASKKMKSFGKENVLLTGGYFAGTGTLYAIPCWQANNDPKRSVETAKLSDIYSGGEVKFCDFVSNDSNLNYPQSNVTIQMVDQAILTRGLAMKINANSTQTLPFPQAANDIPDVAEIREKIARGELSANAPCDGMYKEWTAEEKADLKGALADVFGWKK